jgi:Zn ribbon nucleic-acid-binding protein
MVCPQCQSDQVLAERYNVRRYHTWHYSIAALVLEHLIHLKQKRAYREDGALCECMNCGFQWRSKREQRQKRYAQILTQQFGTIYWGVVFHTPDGRILELGQNSIVLIFPNGRNYTIPYSELAAVSYQKNLGPLHGWLTIRDRAHKKRPIPINFKYAKIDSYTLFYNFEDEKVCYETYLALQKIVEENKKAGLI